MKLLERCDGEITFAQIVDDLVKTYNAPRERITTDVIDYLRSLKAVGAASLRRLIQVGSHPSDLPV